MMERAVILCRVEEIGVELLAVGRADNHKQEAIPGSAMSLEALERLHIERILASSENLDAAAKTLGIDASTLYRKRKAYKL
jgi:NtrC-family two-component system response regulator AlgB